MFRSSTSAVPRGTGRSGAPEVPLETHKSPPLRARKSRKPVLTAIEEECDRLLCDELRRTFNCRDEAGRSSLVISIQPSVPVSLPDSPVSLPSYPIPLSGINVTNSFNNLPSHHDSYPPSPPNSASSSPADETSAELFASAFHAPSTPRFKSNKASTITHYLELWDYLGGASFRGLIASTTKGPSTEKTLFLFLDNLEDVELKNGLVALMELALEVFDCEKLVLALRRDTGEIGLKTLTSSLGWMGFELVTLSYWQKAADDGEEFGSDGEEQWEKKSKKGNGISDKWLFVGIEL